MNLRRDYRVFSRRVGGFDTQALAAILAKRRGVDTYKVFLEQTGELDPLFRTGPQPMNSQDIATDQGEVEPID